MARLLSILNTVRLSLFGLAYGVVGVLVAGTLNRVLLVEVGLSKALVGLMFALPYLESPIRVWLGYRSDGFPVLGKRREPWIVLGAIIGGLAVVLVTWLTLHAQPGRWVVLAALTLALLLYGFGRSLAHNSFQAMLTDKYEPKMRRSVATLFEVVTLIGSVIAGGLIAARLKPFTPEALLSVSLVVMGVFILFALIAAPGQERRNPALDAQTAQAREQPFWPTVKRVLLPDPQVRIFFALILCAFVGTLAQDVWLEGFGGEVLGMSVSETTALQQYWGPGVLISMLLSGLLLLPLLGQMPVMRTGFVLSALAFVGVIVVGAQRDADLFRWLVFAMGLATGMAGAGMLASVVTFSTPLRAGLMMGVWGMANALGRALGTFMGGALAGIVESVTKNVFLAYSSIFALEAAMLVVALVLSFRLRPEQARVGEEARAAAEQGKPRVELKPAARMP